MQKYSNRTLAFMRRVDIELDAPVDETLVQAHARVFYRMTYILYLALAQKWKWLPEGWYPGKISSNWYPGKLLSRITSMMNRHPAET
jgi:hypothetical protein